MVAIVPQGVTLGYGLLPLRGEMGFRLADQFMVIRNYAKDTQGLFARIIAKISALTALQYSNYVNNRPVGRIKYALL